MALLAWLQNGAATSYGKPSPAQATEIAGLLATGKLSQQQRREVAFVAGNPHARQRIVAMHQEDVWRLCLVCAVLPGGAGEFAPGSGGELRCPRRYVPVSSTWKRSIAMTARFIVLYGTPADPAAFDRYYRDVHIPLSHHLPGLRSYTVARDASAVRGGDPYYLIGELEWDTMEDLRAAMASPEGQAAAADAAVLAEMTTVRSMVFTPAETLAGT
jgi:uncharacterized protein (TIGR02118 family)